MMELAHSLLLNEEALQKIPDNKKPVFVFEWLRFLDKVLSAAQKVVYHFFSHYVYGLQFICLFCTYTNNCYLWFTCLPGKDLDLESDLLDELTESVGPWQFLVQVQNLVCPSTPLYPFIFLSVKSSLCCRLSGNCISWWCSKRIRSESN